MGKNIFRTFVFICSQFLDSKSHRFNRQISTAEFVSPNESRTCEDLRSVFFSCFFRRKRGARPVRVSGDHPVLPHEKQPELGATMELPRPQLGRDQYPQCWICLFDWPIGIRHRPKSSPFIRSSLKVAPEVVDQQHRHSWFILARCAGGSLLRDCCMVRGRGMEARAVVEKRKLRI